MYAHKSRAEGEKRGVAVRIATTTRGIAGCDRSRSRLTPRGKARKASLGRGALASCASIRFCSPSPTTGFFRKYGISLVDTELDASEAK